MRVFSATMHYHFAFLAISLAMLGGGAGGVLVHALRNVLVPRDPAAVLASTMCAAALSIDLATWAMLEGAVEYELDGTGLARLARAYAGPTCVFALLGFALAFALATGARRASRLYAADLGGAAVGCALAIPLLAWRGAVDGLVATAVLAALSGAAFAAAGSLYARLAAGLTLAATLALACANPRVEWIAIHVDRSGDSLEGELYFAWNSFSRVAVRGDLEGDGDLLLSIDSDAASPIFKDAAVEGAHDDRAHDLVAFPHHVIDAQDVLVIGPGGGAEVVIARAMGARRIVACEMNPLVARAMEAPHIAAFTGGPLYRAPGVELVIDDGRHYARAHPGEFDVVQLAMVDTWAASAAGAFALAENHLYTVEGFKDLLGALRPGGVLAVTRWRIEPDDQLRRLLRLVTAALEARGSSASGHSAVAAEPPREGRARVLVLVGREPLSAETRDRVAVTAEAQRLEWAHDGVVTSAFWNPSAVPDSSADVTPPTDDRPFFFHTLPLADFARGLAHSWEWRKSNLGATSLALALGTSALGLALVLLLATATAPRGTVRAAGATVGLGAALGAGYIAIEVALVERLVLLLGHPSYALAVALTGLLGWSALGSAISARCTDEGSARGLARASGLACAVALVAAFGLGPAIHALVALARPTRIAIAFTLLAPVGLALGRPFPLALRTLHARDPGLVAWAWAANGVAAVLGGAGAFAIAMTWGFRAAFLAGAACYALAWGLATFTRGPVDTGDANRPSSSPATPEERPCPSPCTR